MKKVSVVMSTYNESIEWIQQSVESILGQTYTNFEFIIVIDNPDNFEIKKLIGEYKKQDNRITIIENSENLGLVASLNKAISESTTDIIVRMDADDISTSTRIYEQIEYMNKTGADFIFSGVKVIDENGHELYSTDLNEYNEITTRNQFEYGNISKHPTWMLKREIYLNLEGYRDIKYCEDFDFVLRSLSKNYKVMKMEGFVLNYRIRKSSISRKFSLEQYLNSNGLLKLYNKNQIFDTELVQNLMKDSYNKASEIENSKFQKGDQIFSDGVRILKDGSSIVGGFKIVKSLTYSKYIRQRFYRTIVFKFHRKFSRK